ncbi:hypothetical protein BH23CHL8_BH23CHL8_30680 [soil metagenome]
MEQWKAAREALVEQRTAELRALTDEQAQAATLALLDLGATLPLASERETGSGLVVQQAILHRRPPSL